MNPIRRYIAVVLAAAVPLTNVNAAELRGSPRSMQRQHAVAIGESLDFAATAAQLRWLVASGELVPVDGNADYVVDAQVPHRFARPEVRLLVERLAAQFHAATGRRLVVTSLVRPSSEQPRNAHPLSVHPVGMALDLRIPVIAGDRAWLERTLLALEGQGVLDVTRERRPPHYHVAVYPAEYLALVARRDSVVGTTAPIAAPPVNALVTLAAERKAAVDVSDHPAPAPARLPVSLAGLAFGGLAVGVVRRERRRADRRRAERSERDRRG